LLSCAFLLTGFGATANTHSGPACSALDLKECSVVKPPAPAPPPGGGSGGGGGSDGGGSGGAGSGGGGSGGGGAELPDCSYEEVGHLCVSLPGPGDGGGGGGGAPARPAPPTRIPESQFQSFDIP